MHVQDSLVEHSDSLERQCEQLLSECQRLEAENSQQETDIASLKREIRHKQRTMSTLELMLLNSQTVKGADTVQLTKTNDKENAAKEANALVDELLRTSSMDDAAGTGPSVQGRLAFIYRFDTFCWLTHLCYAAISCAMCTMRETLRFGRVSPSAPGGKAPNWEGKRTTQEEEQAKARQQLGVLLVGRELS